MTEREDPPDRAPLRVAVIGAGWWAVENHLPVLSSRSDVEVRAVCRKGAVEVEQVAERFGVPIATEDHELLPWDELDAVVVCSPHSFHHQHAMAALDRGLHVMCEKPLAITAADAFDMVRRAEEREVVLLVPHGWQFLPQAAAARQWIREGRIGRLEHVVAQMASPARGLFSGEEDSIPGAESPPEPSTWVGEEGGYAYGQLSHLYSLVFWLTGLVPDEVMGAVSPGPAGSDLYDAFLTTTRQGPLISVSGGAGVPTSQRHHMEVRVFGTEGVAIVDLERDRIEVVREDGDDYSFPLMRGATIYPATLPVHAFCDLAVGYPDAVNHGDAVASALGIAVIQAALRSAQTRCSEPVSPSVAEAEANGIKLD
ncbi:MAG: Gfo/Idh/MocA family oxidoreductase [bacterium]|nr:Gfo/Idh/MocA family oxidoreductase [bacterium]MDE0501156.1 Gfo/Idh/MocA family oxidoreductase [bacterium]